MSVKVEISELTGAMAEYSFAYLMTVGEDMRVHAVAVTPTLADGRLVVEDLGRRTRTNLGQRPEVSLVWPPRKEGGYSLIVDASATVSNDRAVLEPTRAVLHRPAPAEGQSGTGCGSDCVPVGQT
jgi:hypothetical protein